MPSCIEAESSPTCKEQNLCFPKHVVSPAAAQEGQACPGLLISEEQASSSCPDGRTYPKICQKGNIYFKLIDGHCFFPGEYQNQGYL